MKFTLSVTDGRKYTVYIGFDNYTSGRETVPAVQYFIAVLLKRIDDSGKSNKPVLFINRFSKDHDPDIWSWLSAIEFNKDSLDIKNETAYKYMIDKYGKYRTISGPLPEGQFERPSPSEVIIIGSKNIPQLTDDIKTEHKLSKDDKVRLYYACPTENQVSSSNCVVYKYDLYNK